MPGAKARWHHGCIGDRQLDVGRHDPVAVHHYSQIMQRAVGPEHRFQESCGDDGVDGNARAGHLSERYAAFDDDERAELVSAEEFHRFVDRGHHFCEATAAAGKPTRLADADECLPQFGLKYHYQGQRQGSGQGLGDEAQARERFAATSCKSQAQNDGCQDGDDAFQDARAPGSAQETERHKQHRPNDHQLDRYGEALVAAEDLCYPIEHGEASIGGCLPCRSALRCDHDVTRPRFVSTWSIHRLLRRRWPSACAG